MEKKSANIWESEGGKATPPEGGNIALPPSYSQIVADFFPFLNDWIQNGIKLRIYYLL